MATKTKVVVVGLGSIGQRHARLLSERSDVEIILCDISESLRDQAIMKLLRPELASVSDFSDALQMKPDIAFICVPNHLHIPIAQKAIESGTDVFMEKPLSDSLPEAENFVQAATSSGRFLQVGYMLRYDVGLITLKEIIEGGGIGNLVGGRAMIGTYITLLNAKGRDRIDQPNTLVVDYTHELDFISWFFGEVSAVSAMKTQIGNMELKPNPNIFQINLKLSSGALVQVHMDYIQFPQRRIFEVYGDRGTLSYDFMTGEIKHFKFQQAHEFTVHKVLPVMERWDDLFREEHESVLSRRTKGLEPVVSGWDGLKALKIATLVSETAI